MKSLTLPGALVLACLFPVLAAGQQVIGVRAGLVNFIAGGVYLNGQRMDADTGELREVDDGMDLKTECGLAEIQLGAGAFLRANQKTQLHMENASLENMVLRLERGSILIEIFEKYKGNNIRVLFEDTRTDFDREGLYRLDANQGRLRVYGGKATVRSSGRKVSAKKEKAVDLHSLAVSKFDAKINDAFHYWAAYRSFKHNKQLMMLHWYSDQWQPLLMNRYRNDYYKVTFHDEEEEDSGPPYSGWYYQWEMEEMQERLEREREMEQIFERIRSSMPDQIR